MWLCSEETRQMVHVFIPDVPAGCGNLLSCVNEASGGPTSGLIESFAFVVPSWTGRPQTPQNFCWSGTFQRSTFTLQILVSVRSDVEVLSEGRFSAPRDEDGRVR